MTVVNLIKLSVRRMSNSINRMLCITLCSWVFRRMTITFVAIYPMLEIWTAGRSRIGALQLLAVVW